MMSDFMFPIYLATNKIQETRQETVKTDTEEGTTGDRIKRGLQKALRDQREAKLMHGNLQISKCLCIIIRSC